MSAPGVSSPSVSVVVPARNEAGNIGPLIGEIAAALAGRSFEVIVVNDASADGTEAELKALQARYPWLRQLRHAQRCGQSAALHTGIVAARGAIVCQIDGDGQNNPVYLPALIEALERSPGVGLAAGQRVQRKVSAFKRLQSRIANTVRDALLRDGARDTGCGLKALPRELALALPYFNGQHRFLYALVRREGRGVVAIDVIDRPRRHGVSNYGMWDRLWIGLFDLFGVWWLIRRKAPETDVTEV